MRRVEDRFLDSVAYLYNSGPDAEAGVSTGGSGFLIRLPFKLGVGPGHVLAVTNAHVIEGGATVIRLNTKDGATDVIELTDLDWFSHPKGDDVAVACLSLDDAYYKYYAIEISDFLTKANVEQYNIGPGDFTAAAGRFITHEGRQRNAPSLRFGSLAQMSDEPVSQSRVRGRFEQESFIVEARSIGGYSGSPVIVGLDPCIERYGRPGLQIDRVLWWLLGISWGHLPEWLPVCDGAGIPLPHGHKVPLNSGMMAVVPAWKIAQVLEAPEMRERLDELERRHASRPELPAAIMDHARPPEPGQGVPPREDPDWFEPAEAARRRDATLRRMLNTPPKPQRKG